MREHATIRLQVGPDGAFADPVSQRDDKPCCDEIEMRLRGSSVSKADERDILETLQGDGEAYARIVRRYQDRISARMRRFTMDRADHEELVQEVFVQAYTSLSKYRGDAPLEHWLVRIATNVGYQHWKRLGRERAHKTVPVEEIDLYASQEPEEIDPEQAARTLHALLSELPPRDRLVITLRHIEGLSVEETAQMTGWSATMVKVQAWRARGKLKRLLQEAGWEVGDE